MKKRASKWLEMRLQVFPVNNPSGSRPECVNEKSLVRFDSNYVH